MSRVSGSFSPSYGVGSHATRDFATEGEEERQSEGNKQVHRAEGARMETCVVENFLRKSL